MLSRIFEDVWQWNSLTPGGKSVQYLSAIIGSYSDVAAAMNNLQLVLSLRALSRSLQVMVYPLGKVY